MVGECGDGGWLRDRLRAATTSSSTSRHPTTGRLAAVAAAGSAVVCLLLEKRSTRRPLLAELRELVITIAHAQLAKGAQALVFVVPAATEVPAVQRLLQQVETTSPSTVVLMINPKLIDMQSAGILEKKYKSKIRTGVRNFFFVFC